MKTIDACGISCPEPLIMLKAALKTEKEFTLLLDSQGTLDNCINYLKKQGISPKQTIDGSIHKLHIVTKNE